MAAKLQIEFQVSKSGNALEIGDKLSGMLKSKSDQIPLIFPSMAKAEMN